MDTFNIYTPTQGLHTVTNSWFCLRKRINKSTGMPDGSNMAQNRAVGAYPEEQLPVVALTISRPLQLHLKIQCFRPLWTQVTQQDTVDFPANFSMKKTCHATPFHKLSFNHLLLEQALLCSKHILGVFLERASPLGTQSPTRMLYK